MTGMVPAAEDPFGFTEMQVVSFADVYAGKIVVAFDRQHICDLFDVRGLLGANEGINDELRRFPGLRHQPQTIPWPKFSPRPAAPASLTSP
jgi:Nucleotidyl transferase AbiEii toxin, Type IV TA system